ncbi:MAG: aspartate/glutamate racemase family protein [Proteobacteria bacterium]|nr:aspartate/glutamate racemase family protein [Pseudomonadota bacterium]
MTRRVLLGMLTPSSNTILEPVTSAMLAGLPEVTAHFGRFRVTEISLAASAQGQFEMAPLLDAARLLADARVEVIAWNGTSAGWLGFDRDRALCAAIARETGITATSSVLALAEAFRATGVARYGLVTPYLHDVQAKIVANFEREGFACAGERHLNDKGNFSFSEVGAETLRAMVRDVARARPDAITIFCTNLNGAPLVESLEREIGIPIYDSIATAVWSSLRLAGIDPARVKGWGRLFREVR